MSLELPGNTQMQPSSPASPPDHSRPSHESQQPILPPKAAARVVEPRPSRQNVGEDYPRLEYESEPEYQPPLRQLARWGPPASGPQSDWGWDDRDDRRHYSHRPSYDWGGPPRGWQSDYYDDPYAPPQSRPYRRLASARPTPTPTPAPRPGSRMGTRTSAPRHQSSVPKMQRFEEEEYEEDEDLDEITEEKPQHSRPRRRRRARTIDTQDSDGSSGRQVIMRLPFTTWMNNSVKSHFVAAIGEFVGTTMFLLFAFAGTQVANIGSNGDQNAQSTTGATNGFSPIVNCYIALAFGFSLMVNVWIFFRISGGLFNPAVTLGMVMVGSLGYVRGFLLLCAQVVGAIFASFLVKVLFPTDFNVRTTLSEDTSLVRGVFIEAVLTAELVFAIFMLAKEKHRATFMAPIGIGLALFIGELVGVFYTGGSLNPARSFGPCVVTGIWDQEHWVYWVGPAVGSVAAVCFYRFIKVLEYEVANPGQDKASEEEAAEEAEEAVRRKGMV